MVLLKKILRKVNKIISMVIRRGKIIDGVVALEKLGLDPTIAHEHADTNDYLELYRILSKIGSSNKVIVDLGCGSGAAIALFEWLHYEVIYGVELSEILANRATENFKKNKVVKIFNIDARDFNEEVDIIFMFNPFPLGILIEVLENLQKNKKELTVIYRNPKYFKNIESIFNVSNVRIIDSTVSSYAIFQIGATCQKHYYLT